MALMVRSNDFKFLPITGSVLETTPKERLALATKRLSIFWGIGMVCVFVPVAHFILVPTFLIAGAITFFKEIQHTHLLKDLSFFCPSCSKQNSYSQKTIFFHDEVRFYCKSCAEQLVLTDHLT